ncbi:hypothetical protein Pmani_012227 [Petrolisthes manimaculis]|uniref:Uncharacterized protein n=1 Tax=Petrolisthes manimaculis TaxID=1843537 RepID=A0AAE1UAP5_9EUCA|nr:hypothetical protein Pmani_012227 [Petrolisthes manimaculis]
MHSLPLSSSPRYNNFFFILFHNSTAPLLPTTPIQLHPQYHNSATTPPFYPQYHNYFTSTSVPQLHYNSSTALSVPLSLPISHSLQSLSPFTNYTPPPPSPYYHPNSLLLLHTSPADLTVKAQHQRVGKSAE